MARVRPCLSRVWIFALPGLCGIFSLSAAPALDASAASLEAPAASVPQPVANWGPLRVGDKVGLKETPPFFELQLHAADRTTGDGYEVVRIVREADQGFVVLAPPPDTLAITPGQVRELWIPWAMVRIIRVR
jgi:hypothetical protein